MTYHDDLEQLHQEIIKIALKSSFDVQKMRVIEGISTVIHDDLYPRADWIADLKTLIPFIQKLVDDTVDNEALHSDYETLFTQLDATIKDLERQ